MYPFTLLSPLVVVLAINMVDRVRVGQRLLYRGQIDNKNALVSKSKHREGRYSNMFSCCINAVIVFGINVFFFFFYLYLLNL